MRARTIWFCLLGLVLLVTWPQESHAGPIGGGIPTITLDQCAPGFQEWDLSSKVVACVENSVKSTVTRMMTGLSNFMRPIVAAMVTFAIGFYGLRVALGEFQGLADAAGFFFRLVFVTFFAFNLDTFTSSIFQIEAWLISLVTNTSPWAQIDSVIGRLVGLGPTLPGGIDPTKGLLGIIGASLVSSTVTSVFFFVATSALINVLLFTLRVLMTYLTAIVLIGFMISLAPIVIPMALFVNHTKKYFDKWVDILASAMLVPVLLFAFLTIFGNVFSGLVDNILYTLCGSGCVTDQSQIDLRAYQKINVPEGSFLLQWDPTLRQQQETALGAEPTRPAVQTNINPLLNSAHDVGSLLSLPAVDFGPNNVQMLQSLIASFLGLFLFASFMKAMVDKIPDLAYNITEAYSYVSMESTRLEKTAEAGMREVQTVVTGRKL